MKPGIQNIQEPLQKFEAEGRGHNIVAEGGRDSKKIDADGGEDSLEELIWLSLTIDMSSNMRVEHHSGVIV